jgi:hypothetical protein
MSSPVFFLGTLAFPESFPASSYGALLVARGFASRSSSDCGGEIHSRIRSARARATAWVRLCTSSFP